MLRFVTYLYIFLLIYIMYGLDIRKLKEGEKNTYKRYGEIKIVFLNYFEK